jgi:hypothetical protein
VEKSTRSEAKVTTGRKGFGASHRVKSSEQVEAGQHVDQGWEYRSRRRVKNLELCKKCPNKEYVALGRKKMLGSRHLLLAVCLAVACKCPIWFSFRCSLFLKL